MKKLFPHSISPFGKPCANSKAQWVQSKFSLNRDIIVMLKQSLLKCQTFIFIEDLSPLLTRPSIAKQHTPMTRRPIWRTQLWSPVQMQMLQVYITKKPYVHFVWHAKYESLSKSIQEAKKCKSLHAEYQLYCRVIVNSSQIEHRNKPESCVTKQEKSSFNIPQSSLQHYNELKFIIVANNTVTEFFLKHLYSA